uniref:Uncharacterized protein n=1 Tax=Anguilla anguilla TaxID=7936 RepID=A0A0E9SIM0_ANGAN
MRLAKRCGAGEGEVGGRRWEPRAVESAACQ